MTASIVPLRQRSARLLSALTAPAADDRATDPRLFRSFVILHLVGPFFGLPICAALLLLDDGRGPVALSFTVGVGLFWLLPFLARSNLARAAFLSVQLLTSVSLFGAFFYGGLNSPFAVWLIVAMLLGFLYLPGSIRRCATGMALQGVAFGAAWASWPQPARLTETEFAALFLASSFAAALYVSLVAAFYAQIRKEGSKLAQIAARYEAAARESRHTIRQLEDDDRRDSLFMAGISHELRTALDVVVGYSELLLEDAAIDEREADMGRLTRITTASRQMLALISEGDRLAGPAAEPASASPLEQDRADGPHLAAGACEQQPRRRAPLIESVPAGIVLIAAAALAAPLYPAAAAITVPVLCLLGLLLITRRRADAAGARHLDALTGLLDRHAFLDELDRRLRGSAPPPVALLIADLNGFKDINDTHGHDVGDRLLAQVAGRFAAVTGTEIRLARLGGDEFAAAAFGADAESAIGRCAHAMAAALIAPVEVGNQRLPITVSIGLAQGRAGQLGAKELLRRGEVAMYRAKYDERLPIQTFELPMDEALNFRRTMRADLGEALRGDQIDLHLQPVVDARTGDHASVEALLRWTHPVLGPISPAKLIALAEESGQIVEIDEWVLERALELIKRFGSLPVAINISPLHFRHPDFVRKIVDRLEAHAVPAQLLRLEITEGVLVTHTRAAGRAIGQLREAGIKIALDDFGTGYSSLSYLKDFGFDFLKVDRSFVGAVGNDRQGTELLRAIVELGHSLSMSVIAEGVETAEQAALIQLLGCDFVQGYFTGRPMAADQLEHWRAARMMPDGTASSPIGQSRAA